MSREDYLAGELLAAEKSEWVNGLVYAQAGANRIHVATVTDIVVLLGPRCKELGCFVGSSDLLVETADAFYYPDVVVSCQPDDDERIERHPCFIAEVMSPSTKRVDQIEKRQAYCELSSMRNYWIVDAEHKIVEVWTLTDEGWVGEHRSAGDPISVQCLDLTVRVVDVVGV